MNITREEKALIISALEGDRQGTWGDGRAESIAKLINKIKKEGEE